MAKREHSYNSGRIYRAGDVVEKNNHSGPRQARYAVAGRGAQRAQAKSAPNGISPSPKKGGRKRRWPLVVIAVVVILAVAAGIFMWYLDQTVDPGNTGTITENNIIPKDYVKKKEVYNFLIVGIDYDEDRSTDYVGGLGMTDMILYVNMDVANGKVNILQIPRDSYVGEAVNTGGSGKINALLANGPNTEHPINNLVEVIESQFKLPVDNYMSIDMDGLVSVVDALGGVVVNIPQEMYYEGAYLPQGEHTLYGESVEFFVRNRSGEGFTRGDPDRLNNQRLFYAALFRRIKDMSAGDLVSLLPVINEYINTDFSVGDLLEVAQNLKSTGSENILFCMAPGATGEGGGWWADPTGSGRSVYRVDWYGRQIWQPSDDPENPDGGAMVTDPENPGVANILNNYFRAHGTPVPVEELGPTDMDAEAKKIPENITLYPPNVQMMSDVQNTEGGEPAQ